MIYFLNSVHIIGERQKSLHWNGINMCAARETRLNLSINLIYFFIDTSSRCWMQNGTESITSNLLYRWWFISDRGAGFSEENSLTHLHYRDHSTIPAHFRYHQWEDQANGSTTRDSFTSSFATGFWFTVSNSSLAIVHYQCYYNVVRISSEQFCFEFHGSYVCVEFIS